MARLPLAMSATDSAPAPASAALWRLLRPAALLLGLVVLGAGAALLWSGPAATWQAAQRAGAPLLAGGLVAVAAGFLLRHARWVLLLGGCGHRLPWWPGLRIYLAGLALTSTPGKAGETVRSVFLLRHDVPLPHSLAAFFADRLSDVIGVALLGAAAGALAWAAGVPMVAGTGVLAALVLGVSAGSFALRAAVGSPRWAAWVERLRQAGRPGRWLAAAAFPAAAWARLWTPRRVPLYVAAAVGAYGLQALLFAHIAAAVALPLPAAQAVGMFAAATLIGAASGVPAGLGVMEAALVVQLVAAGAEPPAALAAALLTRLLTFWFGLALGGAALLSLGAPDASTPHGPRQSPP